MKSRNDDIFNYDFFQGYNETREWIVRRIGGQDDRTENVLATVDLDSGIATDRGGLSSDNRGDRLDFDGRLELALNQETTKDDRWVIGGEVYDQVGEAVGKDGACQTVVILKRKGVRGREPRVTR